jgi:hypothetical protein
MRLILLLIGLATLSEGILAQGISAVTRRTVMGGVGGLGGMGGQMGGLGGGMMMGAGGGMGGGMGGQQMGLMVHPGQAAATAVLLPSALPRINAPLSVRPVVDEQKREEKRAEMDARVLSFQQERARQGSASAQLALARRYRDGNGVEKNVNLSRVWFQAAAGSGSKEALVELTDLNESEPKADSVSTQNNQTSNNG